MTKDIHGRDTNLVRGGTVRSANRETSEAVYMTSGYVYDSAEQAAASFREETDNFVYSRYGNPTVQMFENRLALLEGAEACRATGSGMSAVFSAMACYLKAGDRVVASRALFGACHAIITKTLPKWGIETILVDGRDLEAWRAALTQPAQVVFLESPSNPCLELVDIAAVSEMAHAAGALVMVDNVFATPIFQRPLEMGADVVIYSATKHIDGQGRMLGGAILGSEHYINEILLPFYRQTGAAMSAFNAWILLKALETLPLRVTAQTETARQLVNWLADHPDIESVRYPGHQSHPQFALAQRQMTGFGSLFAFDVTGGKTAAFAFLDALRLIDISNNLGDSKTLACNPYTTTHSALSNEDKDALSIHEGGIRISVGLENIDDLKRDIDQALTKARRG